MSTWPEHCTLLLPLEFSPFLLSHQAHADWGNSAQIKQGRDMQPLSAAPWCNCSQGSPAARWVRWVEGRSSARCHQRSYQPMCPCHHWSTPVLAAPARAGWCAKGLCPYRGNLGERKTAAAAGTWQLLGAGRGWWFCEHVCTWERRQSSPHIKSKSQVSQENGAAGAIP